MCLSIVALARESDILEPSVKERFDRLTTFRIVVRTSGPSIPNRMNLLLTDNPTLANLTESIGVSYEEMMDMAYNIELFLLGDFPESIIREAQRMYVLSGEIDQYLEDWSVEYKEEGLAVLRRKEKFIVL